MSDDDTQRYIGELSGLITAGFSASKERYEAMGQRLDRIQKDIADLDDCLDKRADTLTSLIETHHEAQTERYDKHEGRLATLEHDKSKILGGWRALVITWGGAIGGSGVTVGALKWLGLIR